MDYQASTATVRSNLSFTSTRTMPGKASYTVYLLDGSPTQVQVDKKSTGQQLFDEVCSNLSPPIDERDYFGLTFDVSEHGEARRTWLDFSKPIAKQMINASNRALAMNVKFYPPDPTNLFEYTRYLFYLQLRDDVAKGKMTCAFVTQALLGSYVCQADVGDFMGDMDTHFLFDFAFGPGDNSPELVDKIIDLWSSHNGMDTADAELNYIENAKKLPMYGTDLHPAMDGEGIDIRIGINFSGVLIFRDGVRINRIVWPKILKISYKREYFYLRVRPAERDRYEKTIGFRMESHKAAKRLWKITIEHHAFFRLVRPELPSKKYTFGSKPNLTLNTEYQMRKGGGTLKSQNGGNDFDRYNTFGSHYSLPRGTNNRSISMEDILREPTRPGGQDYVVEKNFEAPAAVNRPQSGPRGNSMYPEDSPNDRRYDDQRYDMNGQDEIRNEPVNEPQDMRYEQEPAPSPRNLTPELVPNDQENYNPNYNMDDEYNEAPPPRPDQPEIEVAPQKSKKKEKTRKPLGAMSIKFPWKKNKKEKPPPVAPPPRPDDYNPEDFNMEGGFDVDPNQPYPEHEMRDRTPSPVDDGFQDRPPPPTGGFMQFDPNAKPVFSRDGHKSSFERLQNQGFLQSGSNENVDNGRDLHPDDLRLNYEVEVEAEPPRRPPSPPRDNPPRVPAKPTGVFDRSRPPPPEPRYRDDRDDAPRLQDMPRDLRSSFERIADEYVDKEPAPQFQAPPPIARKPDLSRPQERPPPPPQVAPKPIIPPKPRKMDDTAWMNPSARQQALSLSNENSYKPQTGDSLMAELNSKIAANRGGAARSESPASTIDRVVSPSEVQEAQGTIGLRNADIRLSSVPPPAAPTRTSTTSSYQQRSVFQQKTTTTTSGGLDALADMQDLLEEFARDMGEPTGDKGGVSVSTTKTSYGVGQKTSYSYQR